MIGTIGDYTFHSLLGKGSFATVYRAIHDPTGKEVAIKSFKKSILVSEDDIGSFKNETSILKQIDHPLIAPCYQIFENKDHFFLVMELLPNGSLLQYINDSGGLTEAVARKIFSQIVNAVDYIHNNLHVVHRDLKAENILMDTYNNIRLIDFGLSKTFSPQAPLLNTVCGSPAYAAPELIQGKPYTSSADIWSIGVILYAMVCGVLPFDDDNYTMQLHKVVTTEPEYPTSLSPILIELLKMLLQKDPNARITLEQLKQHPWVSHPYGKVVFNDDFNLINLQDIDQNVVQRIKDLNVDTTHLVENLLYNNMTTDTVSYRIIRREIITDKVNRMYSYVPTHRNSSIIHSKPLPSLIVMKKLVKTRNQPNTQSSPNHTQLNTVLMKKRMPPVSPLVIKCTMKRRTRTYSQCQQSTPPPRF